MILLLMKGWGLTHVSEGCVDNGEARYGAEGAS